MVTAHAPIRQKAQRDGCIEGEGTPVTLGRPSTMEHHNRDTSRNSRYGAKSPDRRKITTHMPGNRRSRPPTAGNAEQSSAPDCWTRSASPHGALGAENHN